MRSRDEPVTAGLHDGFYVIVADAAIDFDGEVQTAFTADAVEAADFLQRIGNEFLAAEAGVDAHDKHVIHDFDHVFEQRNGRRGIQHHTGARAMALDEAERAVEVPGGLVMHRNLVGARFDEDRRIGIGVRDHQVEIEGEAGDFTDGFYDRRPHREIGDEMAVHDVDVEHSGSAAFHLGDVLSEAGKVRREYGWDNLNHSMSNLTRLSRNAEAGRLLNHLLCLTAAVEFREYPGVQLRHGFRDVTGRTGRLKNAECFGVESGGGLELVGALGDDGFVHQRGSHRRGVGLEMACHDLGYLPRIIERPFVVAIDRPGLRQMTHDKAGLRMIIAEKLAIYL